MRSSRLSLPLLALGGIAALAGAFCVRCGTDVTDVSGTSADGGLDAGEDADQRRLVDIDLDDPGIEWSCD
jgi:hypothetical protein